jgi:hypothetical protein
MWGGMDRLLLSPVLLPTALLLLAAGCAHVGPAPATDGAGAPRTDVAIIAGCPTEADGTVSDCIWERALQAVTLLDAGEVSYLLPSGGAVHNRYVEAEASRAALLHLGVPAERIALETQALHTDENAAYSVAVARELGWKTVTGVGGEKNQGYGVCMFAQLYGARCRFVPVPRKAVERRTLEEFAGGFPTIRIAPVPVDEWMPLPEREAALAGIRGGADRPPSAALYHRLAFIGLMGVRLEPKPPMPEPTLASFRRQLEARGARGPRETSTTPTWGPPPAGVTDR